MADAKLLDAIAAIQDIALALPVTPKIEAAPDVPSESINQFPFSVCWPSDIDADLESGWAVGPQDITCQIHWTRANLATAIAASGNVGQSFIKAVFADPTLAGTVADITHVHGKFGFLSWGTQKDVHIGWDFTISVTILDKL